MENKRKKDLVLLQKANRVIREITDSFDSDSCWVIGQVKFTKDYEKEYMILGYININIECYDNESEKFELYLTKKDLTKLVTNDRTKDFYKKEIKELVDNAIVRAEENAVIDYDSLEDMKK